MFFQSFQSFEGISKGDNIFQRSCSTADLSVSGNPLRQSSAHIGAETEKNIAIKIHLARVVTFIFIVNQRYVIATFRENRFNADMILILFLEFRLCHMRGDRCKTFKAD